MRFAWLGIVALTCIAGCYRSHERASAGDLRDGGARDAALAGACRFSLTGEDEVIECVIPPGAQDGCTLAALCACRAMPGDEEEIARCAGGELTARALITFTDFCTFEPPARMTMREALEGYLGERPGFSIGDGDGCDRMPALIGPAPYDQCALVASRTCACLPAPCSLDRALERTCVDMTRAQVDCVNQALPRDGTCPEDLAALARGCE